MRGPAGFPQPPAGPPPWLPAPPMALGRSARWLMVTMLSMTLVAVGAAVAAWLRPLPRDSGPSVPPKPASAFTDQQIADARANVCNAYNIVDRAVIMNTRRTNPVPDDEIGSLATQVYGDLALYEGGDYLLDRLVAEPATPDDLTNPVKSLGDTLKKFGIIVLAGEPGSARDPLRRIVDEVSITIEGLCK